MSFCGQGMSFKDLPYPVYKDLVYRLNNDSSWKKVSIYMVQEHKLSGRTFIDDLERKGNARNAHQSPAELLLYELRIRCFNVDHLCTILRSCELFDALYILYGSEAMEIIKQPRPPEDGKCYEVIVGDTISITCEATGLPPPEFQWFHGNSELVGETSSTLNLLVTSLDQRGDYGCRLRQYNRNREIMDEKYSLHVPVSIKPTPVEIEKHTMSARIYLGEILTLNCTATCYPPPKYQWWRNNNKLDGEIRSNLVIENFQRENEGEYYCVVSNDISTKKTANITVKRDYPRQKAKAKIALLIANNDYEHAGKLQSPVNDAAVIGRLLEGIGFQVICLENLTLREMKNTIEVFCKALEPGTYGLFYFAGHGFSHAGFHMMPVDVPNAYLSTDVLSQDELLSEALANEPTLFVCILDMCLTVPKKKFNEGIYKEVPGRCKYKCNDNLILAYSTCNYQPSYESKHEMNGVYTHYLSKHITCNKPVSDVFTDVTHDVRKWMPDKRKDQKPMVTMVLSETPFYLTDALIFESNNNLGSKSMSKHRQDVADLITFTSKPVDIKFRRSSVTCQVSVRPLNPPYLNAILLTTSGLEEWDVEFYDSSDDQPKLYSEGRSCHIYDPQRRKPLEPYLNVVLLTTSGLAEWDVIFRSSSDNQGKLSPKGKEDCYIYHPQRVTEGGSLMIQIGKNGALHASKRFSYIEHVPDILRVLYQM